MQQVNRFGSMSFAHCCASYRTAEMRQVSCTKATRLFLSVQIPSKEQVDALSAELAERGKDIPAHVETILTDLPPGTHPMTQFSIATLALQVGIIQFSNNEPDP